MILQRLIAWLRQWSYPAAVRIQLPPPERGIDGLALLTRDLAGANARLARDNAALLQDNAGLATQLDAASRQAQGLSRRMEQLEERTRRSANDVIDDAFAIAICNEYFRLCDNQKLLKDKNVKAGEVDRIGRVLREVERVLRDRQIECSDLTNQAYDPGRVDFEAVGKPQELPNLTGPIIWRVDRPLVTLRGRIVQKCKGMVARPAAAAVPAPAPATSPAMTSPAPDVQAADPPQPPAPAATPPPPEDAPATTP